MKIPDAFCCVGSAISAPAASGCCPFTALLAPSVGGFLPGPVSRRSGGQRRALLRSRHMTLAEILHPSCALFLDFDGTMVDLAPQPNAVQVPQPLIRVLRELNETLQGAVAVISGRPIDQIDGFLRPLQLAVAGVHGAERRSAD